MHLPIYYVDAFTSKAFSGNPAAVCPLAGWLDDNLLQAVAAEINLSETAYFVPRGDAFDLRWFTPTCEAQLCGHATLASAFVISNILRPELGSIRFQTRFHGALNVVRDDSSFVMDFPALPPWPCPYPPAALAEGLGKTPALVMQIEDNYFAVYDSETEVKSITPDLPVLKKLHPSGVAITAPGDDSDFVSRYFAPSYGIPEDPVTGSTHSSLTPYWAQRLHKSLLRARQVSKRGGELWCEVKGNRVSLKGDGVLTLRGELLL
jgi:predicted PhzF superfamily epimerase YddE/YHI9